MDTRQIDTRQIRDHMPVVCSEGGQFATVDHVDDGNTIKLTRDDKGQHHWIPVDWVTQVDDKVHVDRPGKKAMKDWMSKNPAQA
jgi:hypothetical protein